MCKKNCAGCKYSAKEVTKGGIDSVGYKMYQKRRDDIRTDSTNAVLSRLQGTERDEIEFLVSHIEQAYSEDELAILLIFYKNAFKHMLSMAYYDGDWAGDNDSLDTYCRMQINRYRLEHLSYFPSHIDIFLSSDCKYLSRVSKKEAKKILKDSTSFIERESGIFPRLLAVLTNLYAYETGESLNPKLKRPEKVNLKDEDLVCCSCERHDVNLITEKSHDGDKAVFEEYRKKLSTNLTIGDIKKQVDKYKDCYGNDKKRLVYALLIYFEITSDLISYAAYDQTWASICASSDAFLRFTNRLIVTRNVNGAISYFNKAFRHPKSCETDKKFVAKINEFDANYPGTKLIFTVAQELNTTAD